MQAQKKFSRWIIWLPIVAIWLIAYYTEWTPLLNNYFLQTIAGFILFLMPGAIFSMVYYDEVKWTQLFTVGLVFSSFAALVLGVISIILGLSADVFHLLFTLLGTLGLGLLFLRRKRIRIQKWETSSLTRLEMVLIGLVILATIGLFVVMRDLFRVGSDYLTYNAMVTEFAGAPRLSLQDPFLGTTNLIRPRLWLVGWILDQSLIVQFSNLNILQIFHFINVSLVIFVQVAIYDLMRRFQVPRKFALTALIFTVFTILTQLDRDLLGNVLIERLFQDKVMTAWILAPIFVQSVYDFLTKANLRNGIMLIILSLVTVNFHGVMFFYIGMITGGFVLLYVAVQSHKWHHIILVALILVLTALIPFTLRMLSPNDFTYETSEILDSGEGNTAFLRLALSDDSVLYGISPSLREGFSFLILYVATILSLVYIKRKPIGYYVITCTIILIAVSNPITAPLIAKIITPFQLWRSPWLMPFGVAGAIVLQEVYHHLHKLSERTANVVFLVIVSGFTLIIAGLSNSTIQSRLNNPPKNPYSEVQAVYDDLIKAGNFIRLDAGSDKTFVFADNPIMYLIPSIDANTHALIWRDHNKQIRMPYDVQVEREIDHNRFYADDITLEEFHELLDKYDIEYLILSPTFIRPLNNLLGNSPRVVGKHMFGQIDVWVISTE